MQQNEVKMRSVVIPAETLKSLRKWYKDAHTKRIAEMESGIKRQILALAVLKGTCSEETLEKITKFVESLTVAA